MKIKRYSSERVKKRRLKLGLTQQDVAFRAGLTVSGIAFIENGKRVPKADTLAVIAAALDKPPGYFFTL